MAILLFGTGTVLATFATFWRGTAAFIPTANCPLNTTRERAFCVPDCVEWACDVTDTTIVWNTEMLAAGWASYFIGLFIFVYGSICPTTIAKGMIALAAIGWLLIFFAASKSCENVGATLLLFRDACFSKCEESCVVVPVLWKTRAIDYSFYVSLETACGLFICFAASVLYADHHEKERAAAGNKEPLLAPETTF